MINLRNALMTGKRLPYDAEVEYIQGTGTQYIDLGPLEFSEFSIGLRPDATASPPYSTCYFGWNNNGSRTTGVYASQSGTFIVSNYNKQSVSISVQDWNTFHEISYSNGIVSIDGSQSQLLLYGSSTYHFGLFSIIKSHAVRTKCAISHFAIYLNGSKTADLIPVRKGTVGYLYDRVLGKLFGNAGTGAFTYGNDLKYPIPAS